MKNSKRISVIIISAILIITVMTGCSKNEEQDNTTTIPSTSATTTTQPVISTTAPTTTQPSTSTTAPTTTELPTSTTSTTEYIPPVTETTTSATPAINYPLINENNGFTLTLNADGTFVHSGVYNMDLSAIGINDPLPIAVESKGNYTVNSGSFSLANTKIIINCTDETVNQLSGVVKIAARALKNIELTDKSTVSLSGGQLSITFAGSNGSDNYTFSTHTISADQTSALLSH
ncbi:MAG: hypothetical protein E7558_07410 [Ruminococcaceae bacterium]|nr:hypothetical protein [Oscillospiraceae bacterium]